MRLGGDRVKLREKNIRFDNGKTFVGKKKKYNVKISYVPSDFTGKKDYWYFLIDKEDINYSYNSLWDNLHYKTQEECVETVEKKIDELVANGK